VSSRIAGKKCVLPVQAGGLEKIVSVEIGADTHLDSVDELHQDQTGIPVSIVACENGGDVGTFTLTADEGRRIRPIGFQDIAGRPLRNEAPRGFGFAELENRRRGKSSSPRSRWA
jgi:hypothetical protein